MSALKASSSKVTGSSAAEIVLLRTSGHPAAVAAAAEPIVSSLPGVKVRDIGSAQHLIGSSLTAVDLAGLTRIELVFAVIMVAGATGLVLALGLADRRRGFAVLSALGAKPRQLSAFLWSEGCLIFSVGGAIGLAGGLGMAWMLVKLLTGVFDPPPDRLSTPVALRRRSRYRRLYVDCDRRDRGATRHAHAGGPTPQRTAVRSKPTISSSSHSKSTTPRWLA